MMLRRLVVSLLLLWLPFQGLAALTMPFCRHAVNDTLNQYVREHDHSAQGADATHSHLRYDQSAPQPSRGKRHHSKSLICNDCGPCHLACAATMMSAPIATAPSTVSAGISVQ